MDIPAQLLQRMVLYFLRLLVVEMVKLAKLEMDIQGAAVQEGIVQEQIIREVMEDVMADLVKNPSMETLVLVVDFKLIIYLFKFCQLGNYALFLPYYLQDT